MKRVATIIGILVLWSSSALSATLTWNANTESDLAGYQVYQCSQQPCFRTSSNVSLLATLGKVTSFNVGTPTGIRYYFITAYDLSNNESASSNLVIYTPPGVSPPGSPPIPPTIPPTPGGLHITTPNITPDPD